MQYDWFSSCSWKNHSNMTRNINKSIWQGLFNFSDIIMYVTSLYSMYNKNDTGYHSYCSITFSLTGKNSDILALTVEVQAIYDFNNIKVFIELCVCWIEIEMSANKYEKLYLLFVCPVCQMTIKANLSRSRWVKSIECSWSSSKKKSSSFLITQVEKYILEKTLLLLGDTFYTLS